MAISWKNVRWPARKRIVLADIGASGLIFGLIAFLIVSGFLEKRPVPLLIADFSAADRCSGASCPRLAPAHLGTAIFGVQLAAESLRMSSPED